jgi:hypothetical protein
MQAVLTLANDRDRLPLTPELQEVKNSLIRALEVVVGERDERLFTDVSRFESPLAFYLVDNDTRRRWEPSTGRLAPGWNMPGKSALFATVALLHTDPDRRRLLRRCDECRRFFMAKGNFERPHHFCGEPCRRRFDVKHRDPNKQREYMRAYRQRKKEAASSKNRK